MAILSSSILQKEPNPGVFERVRDILLATSYTKKDQLTSWTRTKERAILRMAVVFGAIHEPRPTVL